jgi:hypothetical protein
MTARDEEESERRDFKGFAHIGNGSECFGSEMKIYATGSSLLHTFANDIYIETAEGQHVKLGLDEWRKMTNRDVAERTQQLLCSHRFSAMEIGVII